MIICFLIQIGLILIKYNEDKIYRFFHVIANAVLIAYIYSNESELNPFFVSIILVALFSLNIKNIMDTLDKFGGVYIGIKYTILTMMILDLFDAAGIVYSILFFVLATACITVGMIIKEKSFRIYGLILSLISVVKLILIDISYDNTIKRAVSFLICGILCFVISFIYNKLDKMIEN